MKNQKKYRGFTLFEVLVSIIILGIVMSSFPIIFQTMTTANKQVLREEIFFQEFTILSLINPRYFDEKNTIDDNFYKDLNATGGDSELLNNYSSKFAGLTSRIGKATFNNNILRSGSSDTTSSIGLDAGENASDVSTYDDIDDFNGYSENFLSNTIHVNVKYISDNAAYSDENISFTYNYSTAANNTNIKLITIWAQVGDTNITLKYPTCNIGASKFLSLEEISR
ncbi:prokaryotic N-terminal methylation motif domain protein [Nautilia profundicola AmH]|uniref:Prokaryotic N-terminal methylation motif domain protein n=1 Tax=Nautilia profundicola (strain ATCC BAA-1463 / DSM 18972 / AmH) TaxID=598659 RepID=B9L9D0_NAUPA|nr:type II secretion system protein [Nautilia profundicola]ACM92383.1 prokaryotic N-terminal methylation motif domain protein [Nautilia profundicola AmH]